MVVFLFDFNPLWREREKKKKKEKKEKERDGTDEFKALTFTCVLDE